MKVLGAVLAGGASSRFGSDKALALWRGRTLLDHARATLAGVVDEVVVVGRGEVADLPRAGLGPLGGIAGALDHAERHKFESVLTIACDIPDVPEALLLALLQRTPTYCPDTPIIGHWLVTLGGELIERLDAHPPSPRPSAGVQGEAAQHARPCMPQLARHDGGRVKDGGLSVRRWAVDIGAIAIPSPTPIANINTPADLATL